MTITLQEFITVVGWITTISGAILVIAALVTWATTTAIDAGKNSGLFLEFLEWKGRKKKKVSASKEAQP